MPAAVPRRVEAGPGVQSRIAGIHRHHVQLPLQLPGLGVVRLKKARRIQIVTGADDDMVVNDDRGGRREVLLLEVGNLDVPFLLAGLGVEGDQIVIRRLEVQRVVAECRAAVADVRAASGLPVVLPADTAVVRVECPDIVWCGHVQHFVHHQDGSLDVRRTAGCEFAGADAADDHRRACRSRRPASRAAACRGWTCAAARSETRDPRQREVLDGAAIDLLQGAETTPRVVAGIDRPRI